jgi:hypothetical protein
MDLLSAAEVAEALGIAAGTLYTGDVTVRASVVSVRRQDPV